MIERVRETSPTRAGAELTRDLDPFEINMLLDLLIFDYLDDRPEEIEMEWVICMKDLVRYFLNEDIVIGEQAREALLNHISKNQEVPSAA